MDYLITPDGDIDEAWKVATAFAGQHALDDEALIQYLILNMGHVLVAQFPDVMDVRLRGLTVSPAAIAALMYATCDWNPGIVCLSFYDERQWQCYRFKSLPDFIEVLNRLDEVNAPKGDQRLLTTDIDIRSKNIPPEFREVLKVMEQRADGETDSMDGLLRTAFDGRFIFAQLDSNVLRVQKLGHGYTILGHDWCKSAVGTPLEQTPDRQYGTLVAKTFRRAAQTGRPILQAINTTIKDLHGKTHFASYQRLVVPIGTGKPNELVLGVTKLNCPTIAL